MRLRGIEGQKMARLEGNPLSGREIGGNGARGGPSEGFVKKFEHESSDFARATQLHTHTHAHTHTHLTHTHTPHTHTRFSAKCLNFVWEPHLTPTSFRTMTRDYYLRAYLQPHVMIHYPSTRSARA